MKTTFTILVFLLIINDSTIAQNFAPLNSTWYFQDFRVDCSPNFFIKIVAEHDTIIDNKYVTILEVYNNEDHIQEGRLLIHESDNRVYFYEDNQFKLLYDFNLMPGDTMISHIPTNRTQFDISCLNGEIDLFNYKTKVIVDSVGIIEVDNQELKVLFTRPDHEDDLNECFVFRQIIERIGSKNGLCGWYCAQCLWGCLGHFRCYSDNDINYKPAIEDCEFGLNSVSHIPEIRVKIFPNPTSNIIYIDNSGQIEYFRIFDLSGKLLIEGKLEKNQINLNKLQSGIFMLTLENRDEKMIYSNKILKL